MSHRILGELGLDHQSLRAIWEDGHLPASSTSTSNSCSNAARSSLKSNHADVNPGTGLSKVSAQQSLKSASMAGSLDAPRMGGGGTSSRKPFGGYDIDSTESYHATNGGHQTPFGFTALGSPSKLRHPLQQRASVSSLWESSISGYSTGESSGYSTSTASYLSDYSPPSSSRFGSFATSRASGTPIDSALQVAESQHRDEKDQVELISKAICNLLLSRNSCYSDRSDLLRELLGVNQNRRASVACSGGQSLEREQRYGSMHGNGGMKYNHHPDAFNNGSSMFSSVSSTGSGNSSSGMFNSPSPYEAALERIEREAKMRRTSAYQTDTSFTWKGTLSTRFYEKPVYATKIFVGGLPYCITPEGLTEVFGKFGLSSVQFPPRGRGHAYLVFDTEQQVQALLDACECKGPGQYFYWVASRRGKDRQAQVIPWATEDSDWVLQDASEASKSTDSSLTSSVESLDESSTSRALEPASKAADTSSCKQNTVFVGALHGEITAEGLQKILSELFGPVAHVGIDTDKNHYPNGSARATFVSRESFHRAVAAEFVQVVTPRFSKTIQLDAYIEDGICSECRMSTPVFCRHPDCFRYYCPLCFDEHRRRSGDYHPPVMRNRNSNSYGSGQGNRGGKDRSHTV